MRSITSRFDPSRPKGSNEVRSKYIFAFEGNSTEVAYFKGIAENRRIAGVDSLIGLCILKREAIDSGCSGPLSMLKILKENIRAMRDGNHNIQTICELVRAYIGDRTGASRNDSIIRSIDDDLPSLLGGCCEGDIVIDTDNAKRICDGYISKVTGKDSDIIIPEPESYDPDVDHVCVMVDRDRESHAPQVIDDFITECRKNGFEPYITNPCFEFWLMLHFDEVLNVNKSDLFHNETIDGKRFTELKLDEIVNGINPENHYDKTDVDVFVFLHRIGVAVGNSRYYCNDTKCLKHEVGTNLGELFDRIICKPKR